MSEARTATYRSEERERIARMVMRRQIRESETRANLSVEFRHPARAQFAIHELAALAIRAVDMTSPDDEREFYADLDSPRGIQRMHADHKPLPDMEVDR